MDNDVIQNLLTARQRLSSNPFSWGILGKAGTRFRENVIAAQSASCAVHSYEITEAVIAEAASEKMELEQCMISVLLNSGASRAAEMDLVHSRFRRPNHPGDIVFSDMSYGGQMKGVGPFHSVAIYIQKKALLERLSLFSQQAWTNTEGLSLGLLRDEYLGDLVKRLWSETRRPEYASKSIDLDETLNAISRRLLHLSGISVKSSDADDKLRPDSINRVLEYMHANLQRDMTVPELAQIAGVSRGYFARLFLQTVGQTPKAYLMKIRIELARRLLLSQPDATIVEVATQAGFYDSPHFCREFKAQLGITPSQYRQ